MATIAELQSQVATLKSAYDAAAQDLARAQAEYDALVAAAKSTNFKLPEQEAAFIAAREKARSYRDGPLAAATTAENKAAGALYQAEQDLKDAQAAQAPPATQSTQSTGQTVADDQKANAQGADPQAPNTGPQTASATGEVSPAPATTTPTTAEPTPSAETGELTTGTDGRVRPASDVQSSSPSTPNATSADDAGAGGTATGVSTPTSSGAAARGDDGAGLNPVSSWIAQNYGSALNLTPRDNPLDNFPSYTYNLSVYLMTPEQYNAMLSATKPTVAGMRLLMSSGGIPTAQRDQYFPLDYYIDNLQIKTYVAGKGTMGAHTATELSFRVTEPNGLTFIHNLVRAVGAVVGPKASPTAFHNQHYLMVIRFQAMDANGALVNAPSLGSGASNSTIIEKFIPFRITGIRTRVANKLAEYEVAAVCPQNSIATAQRRGTIPYNIQIQAGTLKDMLSVQLCKALNDFQVDLTKTDPKDPTKGQVFEYPDVYEIKLLEPLNDKSVTVMPPGELWRPVTPMGPDPTTAPPNQTMNPKAQSAQTTVKPHSAIAGQSIVQFIDKTVRTSGYIYQQQLMYYDPKTKDLIIQSGAGKYLAWYRITTEAQPMKDKWDRKRNDYAYKITYQVAPYLVTDSLSEYFPITPRWTAPKVYYHWFTGQNTQILDYQQDFNYLYYLVVNSAQQIISPSPLKNEIDKGFQPASGQTDQGITGKVNEPGANAADRFYSPGDLAKIRMIIVGDPDWIAQGDVWSGVKPVDPSGTLPDGTINFASREPLFDVVFNTPADYDMDKGIIDPAQPGAAVANSPIPAMKTVTARYLAVTVVNNFDKGKFTQELNGVLVMPTPTSGSQQAASGMGAGALAGPGTPTLSGAEYTNFRRSEIEEQNGNRTPTTGRYGPNISTSGTLANPSTPEEMSVANDSATGTEFLDPPKVKPAAEGSGTTSAEPPPTIGPQPAAEPPTSNGQDVSVPQTTPQPSPSTGYVTSIPDGVTKNAASGSYTYEGQTIVAGTNDALSAQVTAIRTGNEVTYQDYDPNAGWVTKTYDPQTKTYKIIGDAPNPYASTSTSAPSQNMAQEY